MITFESKGKNISTNTSKPEYENKAQGAVLLYRVDHTRIKSVPRFNGNNTKLLQLDRNIFTKTSYR